MFKIIQIECKNRYYLPVNPSVPSDFFRGSNASFGVRKDEVPSSVVLRIAERSPLASNTDADILRHGVVTIFGDCSSADI